VKAKVLKLEKKLFDGEVSYVVLPATLGEICILPNHMAIVTTLKKGVIRVFKPNRMHSVDIEIDGGVCSFFEEVATCVVNF
jgi:F-type H+-transporting ATPase subunit epsilon